MRVELRELGRALLAEPGTVPVLIVVLVIAAVAAVLRGLGKLGRRWFA